MRDLNRLIYEDIEGEIRKFILEDEQKVQNLLEGYVT